MGRFRVGEVSEEFGERMRGRREFEGGGGGGCVCKYAQRN